MDNILNATSHDIKIVKSDYIEGREGKFILNSNAPRDYIEIKKGRSLYVNSTKGGEFELNGIKIFPSKIANHMINSELIDRVYFEEARKYDRIIVSEYFANSVKNMFIAENFKYNISNYVGRYGYPYQVNINYLLEDYSFIYKLYIVRDLVRDENGNIVGVIGLEKVFPSISFEEMFLMWVNNQFNPNAVSCEDAILSIRKFLDERKRRIGFYYYNYPQNNIILQNNFIQYLLGFKGINPESVGIYL